MLHLYTRFASSLDLSDSRIAASLLFFKLPSLEVSTSAEVTRLKIFGFVKTVSHSVALTLRKVYIADSCSFTSVDPDKDDHLEMADLEKSTFDFSEKGWTMEQTGITKNEHHSWSSSLHSHILLDLCLASIFSSRNSK